MVIKHWIRENGKGYFIGPEEEMYHETDQECPPRPSEDHWWKDGEWVIDPELQKGNMKSRANQELERLKAYQLARSALADEELKDLEKYEKDLAMVLLDKKAELPSCPDSLK